jgi:hypothetical protein
MSDSCVAAQEIKANAMFNLFRRKTKRPPARSSLRQSSRPQVDPARSDPPTFEGYTIQEVDPNQLEHSIRSARLTPEQLVRWESVLADNNQ